MTLSVGNIIQLLIIIICFQTDILTAPDEERDLSKAYGSCRLHHD